MKRRLAGLAAGTGSSKKKSWKDDQSSGAIKKGLDSDAEDELLADAKANEVQEAMYIQNPVVWLDVSVAGKPRGKVFLELFSDTVPDAVELMKALCAGPLEKTEFHKIVPRKFAEGGDVDLPQSVLDDAEGTRERPGERITLSHTKAGLLSCPKSGPNARTILEFQITLRAEPELDKDREVFGQVVASVPAADGERLHPLHWISASGNADGSPRDTVLVEACGVCSGLEAEKMTGQPIVMEPPFPPKDSQEERYNRAGKVYTRLADAVNTDNVKDTLELTEDLVDYLEYTSKKAKETGGGGGTRSFRSAEIEEELKVLRGVFETASLRAGDEEGFDNALAQSVKNQQNRVKDLGEILNRVF